MLWAVQRVLGIQAPFWPCALLIAPSSRAKYELLINPRLNGWERGSTQLQRAGVCDFFPEISCAHVPGRRQIERVISRKAGPHMQATRNSTSSSCSFGYCSYSFILYCRYHDSPARPISVSSPSSCSILPHAKGRAQSNGSHRVAVGVHGRNSPCFL